MDIISKLKVKLFSGHERSVKAKKNIIAMFTLKGYSIAISLALIPLTLKLLDNYIYGVWITIFNVLSWIQIFDIGIGNGLRNKFAEAIARNDIKNAREYVSTAYVIMGFISLALIILFFPSWRLINWAKVFNVKQEFSQTVTLLIGITFILTAIQFSLKLIGTILTADQKPAASAAIGTISNTIILLIFLVVRAFIKGSLIAIGTIYTATPLIVFIVISLLLFNGKYKSIKPAPKFYTKEKVKDLFSLGIQFFIIQIAALVIFQTDSLIIAHTLSPEEVTPYNIVFRYFSIITMFAGIVMTPFWSAYTDAATKNDYIWIRRIIIKQIKMIIVLTLLIIVLLIISRPIIKIWTGKDLNISNNLLLGMSIYVFLSVWNNIFSFLLGGLSKIRLGTFITVFTAILNIPLSIYFINKIGHDSGGVIYATCLCIGISALISPIQTYYFIFSKKKNYLLDKLLR